MELEGRASQFRERIGGSSASSTISWSTVGRGALLAIAVIFALSTQMLFQPDLYQDWPIGDILLGWMDYLLDLLIVGGCIFAGIALAILVPARSTTLKHLALLGGITLGALCGEAALMLRTPLPPDVPLAWELFAKVARWVVISGLAYAFFALHRQAAAAAAQVHAHELQQVQLDQQMTEARLQSLRARIEPHFLFNTLANIQQLYRTEPVLGRRVLRDFVAYLRAALPQMRSDETTLGNEVALAQAYLNVLQVRMGDRLKTRFDIAEDLRRLPFPPFGLSTLTENAIKHGLNPLPQGGTLEVAAQVEEGRLTVSVSDTGAGLRRDSGTGGGLANLRARLAMLYGEAGKLALQTNVPRGIRATITVPLPAAGSRAAIDNR